MCWDQELACMYCVFIGCMYKQRSSLSVELFGCCSLMSEEGRKNNHSDDIKMAPS